MIVFLENEPKVFENFSELFEYLNSSDRFISDITDDTIIFNDNSEVKYGLLTNEPGLSDMFKKEVVDIRSKLRESVALLKKQNINVPKKELDKLSAQFEFLK